MKIHQPTADYSECMEVQQKLLAAVDKLSGMANNVALARHVREYDGDRRKRVLATATLPFLKAGGSSAAADTEARASETYQAAMQQLGKEFTSAEKVLADWDATKIQVDVLRSLLALQRSQITQL